MLPSPAAAAAVGGCSGLPKVFVSAQRARFGFALRQRHVMQHTHEAASVAVLFCKLQPDQDLPCMTHGPLPELT